MSRERPAQRVDGPLEGSFHAGADDSGHRFSDSTIFRVGLGAVLLAFGLFLWASVAATRKLADANDASLRAVTVLRRVDELTTHATRIENGFHAFILTRDIPYQVAWRNAQTGAWAQVQAIRTDRDLTTDQTRHLDAIQTVLEDWLAAQEPVMQAVRDDTTGAPVDAAVLAAISELGRQLDMHAEAVQRIEATRMNVVAVHAEAQQRRALVYATLAAALIPFLIFGIAILWARHTARMEATIATLEREGEERAEIEASLERLARRHRVILDAAADGIVEVDANGIVTFLNPAALAILGIRKHAAGQPYGDVVFGGEALGVDAEQASATRQAVELALRDGRVHADTNGIFAPRGGRALPVELQVAPMGQAGRVSGAVITFRDVSAQRELARQRNQLMGILSHELRTPLTSVRGSLGLIAAGPVGALNEKGRELLRIAIQNSDRLMRTIGDILDVERIESGRFDLERAPTPARVIVDEALAAVRKIATEAGVDVESDVADVVVHADRDRIAQVLIHLLENAVKFSPTGTTTRVEVAEAEGSARFTVRDEGFGIPEEQLAGIFDRYHQVDASDSRSRGGAGLGLTLSRGIVREHGAELEVASAPGEGSRFTFEIPLAAAVRESPDRDRRDDPEPDRQAVA